MYMVKDKEVQSVVETRQKEVITKSEQANTNPEVVNPLWNSQAVAREQQYAWKNSDPYRRMHAEKLEDFSMERIVQEINRRIQTEYILLRLGRDTKRRPVLVYQLRNHEVTSPFNQWF